MNKVVVVKGQTDPPTISIAELFPDGNLMCYTYSEVELNHIGNFVLFSGNFPVGEEMEYPIVGDDRTAKDRFTTEEKKALDRAQMDIYNEVRCAAEAHRQVPFYMLSL